MISVTDTQSSDRLVSFGSKRYRASLKSIVPDIGLAELQGKQRCLFGVSLGSSRFEGSQLEASIEWISQNFKTCGIVVGDQIYRLTLQLLEGLETEPATAKAIQTGERFVHTYSSLIRQYSADCKFEFLRLSEVAQSPNYPGYLEQLQVLGRDNSEFQQSLADFSDLYLGRGDKQIQHPCGLEMSQTYLMEEAALFACLQEQGWPCLVYPGSIDSIADLVRGRFAGQPEPLKSLSFVSLDLRQKGLYFADGGEKVVLASDDHSPTSQFAKSEFLAHLNDEQWALFMKQTKLKRFAPREVILEDGKDDRHLCLLMAGRAEVTVSRAGGSHQQIAIMEEGTVFGELSFLDSSPRSACVRALVECEVRTISQRDFAQFRTLHPEIGCEIYSDICRVLAARCRRQTFELQHVL